MEVRRLEMSYMMDYPSATFQYNHRPIVPVFVRDANNNWQTVHMLSDTGNDITIINRQTAMQLGFNPDYGALTQVAGIGRGTNPSRVWENVYIKIGETSPVPITMLVMDTDMNLLGRKDVLDNFKVTYDKGNVVFEQTCQFCGGV